MKRLGIRMVFCCYYNHLVIRRFTLQNKLPKVIVTMVMALLATTTARFLSAEEIIIQQEQISFEKCLKVIDTSQDKLSITPKIYNVSDQKRVAVFKLADGTLTITCDDIEGNVIVTTNTN